MKTLVCSVINQIKISWKSIHLLEFRIIFTTKWSVTWIMSHRKKKECVVCLVVWFDFDDCFIEKPRMKISGQIMLQKYHSSSFSSVIKWSTNQLPMTLEFHQPSSVFACDDRQLRFRDTAPPMGIDGTRSSAVQRAVSLWKLNQLTQIECR